MSEPFNQVEINQIIAKAYQALDQKNPQQATEILAPFAKESESNEAFALCWLGLLGFLDDENTLTKEFRRLIAHWLDNRFVMSQMANITLSFAKKKDFRTIHDQNSLVFLIAQAIGVHIDQHPPSKAEQRSKLYELHAQLCALGDIYGEDQAMDDLEIALSLNPKNAEAWFLLSRIHSKRARWEKALLSLTQIDLIEDVQLSKEKIQWQRALLTLALCFDDQTKEKYNYQNLVIWEDLGHKDFKLDQKQRPIKTSYPKIEVYLHTEMSNVAGQYETDAVFKAEKVWVQPLSPCHGRIIQPSILSFCADFDDLIIWDVQPVENNEDEAIFKAIACLEKGNALSRSMKLPVLQKEQLDQINEALLKINQGIFFYQNLDLDMPHGKLVYPKDQALFGILGAFEGILREMNIG